LESVEIRTTVSTALQGSYHIGLRKLCLEFLESVSFDIFLPLLAKEFLFVRGKRRQINFQGKLLHLLGCQEWHWMMVPNVKQRIGRQVIVGQQMSTDEK
jgi:hypothetical protein